ncbi:hypothetical protein SAMN05216262_13117 [Colwellia chukchiensis]|uniref:Uncharacterized protein n=1 Tax=Colwellia chukchiensis TaxID=641665 RepID=A0A1H7TZA4_9GAMM|nr:hypothetical protein [Colwellia chukchiensis]SEL90202.1 hypothetical protein SAMN05216262_13117 [Colwellia chukchiensis]
MSYDMCSACDKKAIDVRTEIIERSDSKITKWIVCRCEDHIDTNVEEMRRLLRLRQEEFKKRLAK